MHDVGDEYDRIAGIEGVYEKVKGTITALQEIKEQFGFYLSVNCVITRLNVDRLQTIFDWSQEVESSHEFCPGRDQRTVSQSGDGR